MFTRSPWAFGPVVNVISAFCRLPQPIGHGGALSIWKVNGDVLAQMQAKLAHATICQNDNSLLPGPEAQPQQFTARLKKRGRESRDASGGTGTSGGTSGGDAPTQLAASSVAAPASNPDLRDPRQANAVSHFGYPKSQQVRVREPERARAQARRS